MVFFTCNHCGESLKKAAVEKHYQFKACKFPILNSPHFMLQHEAHKIYIFLQYCFKSMHPGRNGLIFLTCVDCLKDFREQEYVAHTKVSQTLSQPNLNLVIQLLILFAFSFSFAVHN